MRSLAKVLVGLWLALIAPAADLPVRPARDPLSGPLRLLAARAAKSSGWPPLRQFAASQQDAEVRGLAYFVLGSREAEAGESKAAIEDLREAAGTRFLLADFAEYTLGATADKAGESSPAIGALEGFATRHPQSLFRSDALELLARVFLRIGAPQRAIQLLRPEPGGHLPSSLALLLAQAYQQAGRLEDAARAFQEVYYRYPLVPESETVSGAVRQLETQLGARFPAFGDDLAASRAETFFENSRFDDALAEYDALLQARPASQLAPRWKIARAKCLLRLKRILEAVEALEALVSTNGETDAARLEALAEADARQGDAELLLRELDQLRELYPQSPAYASALFIAGTFFARRGAWEDSIRYYQPLAQQFPQTDSGREGNWRLAWAYYLVRQNEKARRAFLDHLARYPASPHLVAAVYWLGRLAEERKAVPEARALYKLLNKRYVHSYYAVQARARLKDLPPDPSVPETPKKGRPRSPIAGIAQKIPRATPPLVRPCVAPKPSEIARPYLTLRALNLADLATQYLVAALSQSPGAPDLLVIITRLKAQQRDVSGALISAKRLVPNFSEYDFDAVPEDIWGLLFPQSFRQLVERQARANGLEPPLVMALIRAESAFNPRARSLANARGLMQILPQTASRARRGRDVVARRLYDPAYNVRFGCRYLRGLVEKFDGTLEPALAAYNAGDPRVQTWLEKRDYREPAEFMESIPIVETRAYVEAVLRDAEIYRELMNSTAKFRKCGARAKVESRKSKATSKGDE